MRGKETKINLFDYQDYRLFLRDWFSNAKQGRGSFSFRAFSQRAGFTSPNFFKLVMDGDRNLTEESLPKFILGLKLNKQEAEFFRNLVFFNQARTHEDKNYHYQRLLQSRKYSQLKPLDKDKYEYYSTWYHPVVRELVASKNFDGTPEWIAEKIQPPITPAQVEKSIQLLTKLNLIIPTPNHPWRQTQTLISTGPESSSVVLMNYHKSLLDLTKDIMDVVPATQRDVSAMTLGVAEEKIPELKKRLQEFRKEILQFVSSEEEPEAVVQINLQMFPLTKVGSK